MEEARAEVGGAEAVRDASAAARAVEATSRMTIDMPARARREATSKPRPEAPPVTTATPDVSIADEIMRKRQLPRSGALPSVRLRFT